MSEKTSTQIALDAMKAQALWDAAQEGWDESRLNGEACRYLRARAASLSPYFADLLQRQRN